MLWVRISLHGNISFVIPATDSELVTFAPFTQDIKHLLLWPCASQRNYEACSFHHFNEFLSASGWEGDTQLHLVRANPRRHHRHIDTHTHVYVSLVVVILTRVICLSLMSEDTEHFLAWILLATCTVIIILIVFVLNVQLFEFFLYSGL